jgi:hypothetical protein
MRPFWRSEHGGEYSIETDLKKIRHGYALDSFASLHGPVEGYCKHDNEVSLYIKGGKYLDYLINSIISRTLFNQVVVI